MELTLGTLEMYVQVENVQETFQNIYSVVLQARQAAILHLGEASPWVVFMLIEMIARVIKNEIGYLMREETNAQNVPGRLCQCYGMIHALNCCIVLFPGDQLLKQVAANYLNMVFGHSKQRRNYWNKELKQKIQFFFPNALTKEEILDQDGKICGSKAMTFY
jgi:hypothetical protein